MGIILNAVLILLVFTLSRTSCKSLSGGDNVRASIAEGEAVKSTNQRQLNLDNIMPTGLNLTGNPSDFVNGIINNGSHLVSDGLKTASDGIKTASDAASDAIKTASDTASNVIKTASDAIKTTTDGWASNSIVQVIMNCLNRIWEFFMSLFGHPSAGPVGDGAKLLVNTMNDTMGSIKNTVGQMTDAIGNIVNNPLNASSHLPSVQLAGQGIMDGFNKGIENVGKAVSVFMAASTKSSIIVETQKPPVVQAVANVDNTIHNGIESVEQGIGNLFHVALPTPPRLFGG